MMRLRDSLGLNSPDRLKEQDYLNSKMNKDLKYNNINFDSNDDMAMPNENSKIQNTTTYSKDTDRRFVSIENKGLLGMVDYQGVTKDLLS